MIEVIAIMVLLMMTAVISFAIGSAVGYKAGRKVSQYHTVKRGVQVVAPYARQIFSEFATANGRTTNEVTTNSEYA